MPEGSHRRNAEINDASTWVGPVCELRSGSSLIGCVVLGGLLPPQLLWHDEIIAMAPVGTRASFRVGGARLPQSRHGPWSPASFGEPGIIITDPCCLKALVAPCLSQLEKAQIFDCLSSLSTAPHKLFLYRTKTHQSDSFVPSTASAAEAFPVPLGRC